MAECRELVAQGVKEITLLGQIVTSYGRGDIPVKDGKSPFVQLLEAVDEIEGLERIRFTSPHPKGYGDDLVEAYGRLGKLAESAHIPVQSGSDRVLKLMHRGYTRERFLSIIEKLRRVKPGIGHQHGFHRRVSRARRKRILGRRYRWRGRSASTRRSFSSIPSGATRRRRTCPSR